MNKGSRKRFLVGESTPPGRDMGLASPDGPFAPVVGFVDAAYDGHAGLAVPDSPCSESTLRHTSPMGSERPGRPIIRRMFVRIVLAGVPSPAEGCRRFPA